MTFSCDFIEENSGLVKIGLYYGTTEKGCESCMNVLLKNTDSIVIKEITYSKFIKHNTNTKLGNELQEFLNLEQRQNNMK